MTCVICQLESYAIRMVLEKDCECNYIICYDCWQQSTEQKSHKNCFMCKQNIKHAIANQDFQDCEERDKKYGLYHCIKCNTNLARKDYIKHCKATHCHVECKLFNTECGTFTTCKMKEHFKHCDLCQYIRCYKCCELLSEGHNMRDCTCRGKIIYCKYKKEFLPHDCERIHSTPNKLISRKYCACGIPKYECEYAVDCRILTKVRWLIKNFNDVEGEDKKIDLIDQQLKEDEPDKQDEPTKKQKLESLTEQSSSSSSASSSSANLPDVDLNVYIAS